MWDVFKTVRLENVAPAILFGQELQGNSLIRVERISAEKLDYRMAFQFVQQEHAEKMYRWNQDELGMQPGDYMTAREIDRGAIYSDLMSLNKYIFETGP